MAFFEYTQSPYPIREDLAQAYADYWRELGQPGNWFSGSQRIAIAAEVRNATRCPHCQARKQALSPYNFEGEHLHEGVLDPLVVDAVHRVITDQSRITASYIENNCIAGLSEEQYIELVGIAVTVYSIDEFNRALGLPLEVLPEPQQGEPDHYRPMEAEKGTGFVAMLPESGLADSESDLWPPGLTANVLRALSLVPDAVRGWMRVGDAQYLGMNEIRQFAADAGRSINRMQIELVAGRVSAVNECFY